MAKIYKLYSKTEVFMAVLDTVAIASLGVYSELYGFAEKSNIANIYASFGYLEDAPRVSKRARKRLLNLGLKI